MEKGREKAGVSLNFLQGFTLMEIIVGAIILISIFGSLLASFVSLEKYNARARRRLVAINLARSFLGNLTNEVNEERWNNVTSWLYPGSHLNVINVTVDGILYRGNLTVENVSGQDYRRVVLNITYSSIEIEP